MAFPGWASPSGRAIQLSLVAAVGVVVGLAIGGLPGGSRDAPLPAGEDAPVTAPPETAGTAPAVRPPANVRILALNASPVGGAAGRVGARLSDAGYDVLPPLDNPRREGTASVLYRPTFQAEAGVVASLVGLGPDAVKPAGGAVPPGPGGPPDVVVVVGEDLAGRV